MTKQSKKGQARTDGRAVTNSFSGNEGFQPLQGFDNATVSGLKDGNNGLSLEGLSPAKSYAEGDLIVCALLKARTRSEGYSISGHGEAGWSGADKGYSADYDSILCFEMLNVGRVLCREQSQVLIGDVQDMDIQQVAPISSRVRLYNIKDMIDDGLTRGNPEFYMSIDGTFKVLPRPLVRKRELHSIGLGVGCKVAAVYLDQNTVCMVEGGAEVVKRIAYYRGGVIRKRTSDWQCCYPKLSVVLRADCIFVCFDVGSENAFEVVDVVFGPFRL